MPDFRAQLSKEVSPSDALEERAWNRYYENQCKDGVPASPQLISLIRTMIIQEDADAKKD